MYMGFGLIASCILLLLGYHMTDMHLQIAVSTLAIIVAIAGVGVELWLRLEHIHDDHFSDEHPNYHKK
jgi:uncharacterized membrane protein YfcA